MARLAICIERDEHRAAAGDDLADDVAVRWRERCPGWHVAMLTDRRRAVGRAIGRMARRVTWAADGIAKLAKRAESESVRLTALRAILADMNGRLRVRWAGTAHDRDRGTAQ